MFSLASNLFDGIVVALNNWIDMNRKHRSPDAILDGKGYKRERERGAKWKSPFLVHDLVNINREICAIDLKT